MDRAAEGDPMAGRLAAHRFPFMSVGLLDNLGDVPGRLDWERYLVGSQWLTTQPTTRPARNIP